MITNRLVNATPFKVSIPYDKGITINIPPDEAIDLTIQQLEDFRPGTPGSEETRKILDYHGLFLMDGDKTYETQALAALKSSAKEKRRQVNDFISRQRSNATAAGTTINEETMEAQLKKGNFHILRDQAEKLEQRIQFLEKTLREDPKEGRVRETLDPKKTCFAVEPPKQFLSETALKMFLIDNPELKEKHEKILKGILGESTK